MRKTNDSSPELFFSLSFSLCTAAYLPLSTFSLGSYFFEDVTDGDLQTCEVTSAYYLDMLINYAIPELQPQNTLSEVVWMQDDAPHTCKVFSQASLKPTVW